MAAPEKPLRIWHEWLKADTQDIKFSQCSRGHTVSRMGTWKGGDWAICAFGETTRRELDIPNN